MILLLSLACLNNQFSNDTELDTISLYDQQESTSLSSSDGFSLNLERECENPCTLLATGHEKINRVEYYADGFYLGQSSDYIGEYAVTYDFHEHGQRTKQVLLLPMLMICCPAFQLTHPIAIIMVWPMRANIAACSQATFKQEGHHLMQ